jgi:hypothetical protein
MLINQRLRLSTIIISVSKVLQAISTTIKKKDLLIQINRKPIVMVPPIRIPREPKLPIHIRDLFLEASLLPK